MREVLSTRFGLATHFLGVPLNDLSDNAYQKYKERIALSKELETRDRDFLKKISHWWKQ